MESNIPLVRRMCTSHVIFFLLYKQDKASKYYLYRDFPGGPLAKPPRSNTGLTPGQETRCHMLQLKIPHATTKTSHSQVSKYFKKKRREKKLHKK